MTPKEREAMQQALEALEEMFHSNSTKVAVEKYNTAHNALRESLEQPNEIDWIETNKALAKEIIELKKQAEQKPVTIGTEWKPCMKLPVVVHVREQREGESHVSTREGITPVRPDDLIMRGVAGEEYPIGRELFNRTYTFDTATPVRIKDLTDDEMEELCRKYARFELIREAIAADREKNK